MFVTHPGMFLKLLRSNKSMKVELLVDGRRIPMNNFVQSIFKNVILAMISTLKGVDENWEKIELRIIR